jgi:predicted GIY-YIG superfamily endonuclease
LDARFAQHLRGHTAATRRLGEKLQIVAKKEVLTLEDARRIERELKRKKNPLLAIYYLRR